MSTSQHPVAQAFAQAWDAPTPERLAALLHPETVLYQPHLPAIHGREGALREFRLFLDWVPGFRGEVHRAAGEGDLLFIEWTMHFPLGGAQVPVRAVDRITLAEGRIRERAVYFDTLALVRRLVWLPGEWPAYLRYRTAKRVTG